MKRRRGGNPYVGDSRTRDAQARGYPARSVFKLEEIDRRLRMFKPGQRVLDLGAAPGSWSLYASQRVGPRGCVVAVDLQPITMALGPNVRGVQGDALALDDAVYAAEAPFQVVLSDMAPKTSGAKERDQALSVELFGRAVEVATCFGSQGSWLVAKLFMGPDFAVARQMVARRYEEVRVIRPAGTRKPSSEIFIVGRAMRAPGSSLGAPNVHVEIDSRQD